MKLPRDVSGTELASHRGELRKLLMGMLSGRTQLERGEAARIAREFGCSRENVRLAMQQLGITIKAPEEHPSCTGCGKTMARRKSRLCQSCRQKNAFVSLRCANCGRIFQRRRSHHERYLRKTVTQGRHGPICNRRCGARISRSCSWCGRPVGSRWRSHFGTQAYCGHESSCRIQAHRAIPAVWWGYLTDDLLPMKDHLDGIAQLRATLTPEPVNPQ